MDFTFSQLASVSDLQRNYNSLLDKIRNLAGPIVLLRRNQPEAVLVSIEEYQDMANKRKLYEEREALRMVEAFEKDRKDGNLITLKSGQDLFKIK